MNDTNANVDLTECDREPIRVPGSIQPHGLLLIADLPSRKIIGVAGDVETRLSARWAGQSLNDVLGQEFEPALAKVLDSGIALLSNVQGLSEVFEAVLRCDGGQILVELEPTDQYPQSAAEMLKQLDTISSAFERASSLTELHQAAARAFRELTGFDRVMVYQFLDDATGVVVAEDRIPSLGTFLNHHFPAGDIPKQARELYVRNKVRVIPDVSYVPAPIRSTNEDLSDLDLSDIGLRSVSPIHIQYLKNMEIQASASISIIRDGLLWGMIACHNVLPKLLSLSTRVACQALAGGLARQIRAKDEAETYRERIRLRASEDAIVRRMAIANPLDSVFKEYRRELADMFSASGFMASINGETFTSGITPGPEDAADLLQWAIAQASNRPFATAELSKHYEPASGFRKQASGLLAVSATSDKPISMVWLRPEQIEIVNWAGNPHKDAASTPGQILTPRQSFDKWSEEVRGKSTPWTLNEVESARRISHAVLETVQKQRIELLNKELSLAVVQKDTLLVQKDFLMREIDHRVQNSLQMVSSFLRMQALTIDDQVAVAHLNEARNRLAAISLVHRRLYSDDHAQAVDMSRYFRELCREIVASMDAGWGEHISTDFDPILLAADKAANLGLVLAELVMNASKYAYDGQAGPISIVLEQHRARFRLIVADKGVGKTRPGIGFGSKMLKAVVASLGGELEESDNEPGLRVIVTAPIIG